ncbi:nitrogen regulation protein NR(II) [Sulfurivirga sp.]|uniref:nitrogen regulation protein NR(II) n=1 Tax=Sulfurivirga sp. TaxID=2614236 RepID=UPI0025F9FA2F|nr:nitrogen regulation protein NR(II) [Sulfurivirga sp.]
MDGQIAQELLDGMHTGVLWFDADRRLQYMNLAASAMLFQGLSKARGRPFEWFFPRTEVNWDDLALKVVTLYEQIIEREDGSRLKVSMTLSPYELQGRNGWLVELIEIERHTRIMEEEERWHQYEAGNQLVRTLAHEVKNPLAGIYGASQLLRKRLQNDPKGEQLVDVVAREVKRLQNLVDRMLGPKGGLNLAPHNIHAVLAHVLDALRPEKPDNVAVKLDYDPSIPELDIDFDQMVQVFMNLIRNAFQAMERHGGLVTLRTRVAHRFTLGSRMLPLVVVVQVIDEGEGIPPELFDSIFYPMVTSKPDGSGLGLPISQAILRQHGGLIVAESEPGQTVFSVYLPLERDKIMSREKAKDE